MDSQKSQRGDVRIFIGGNREQQLLNAQASSHGWGLFRCTRVKLKASGRDVGNGEVGPRMQTEKIVAPRIKQSFIGDRPRGQDTGDATFDHALGFFGIFQLVDHRTAPALFEHGGQIPLQSVVRNPRHGHAFGPLGQRDSQNPVGDLRVVVEEFIEISHAEKENALGVLGFDFEPLLHRRSLLARRGRGLGVRNGNGSRGRIEGDFHRRGCRFRGLGFDLRILRKRGRPVGRPQGCSVDAWWIQARRRRPKPASPRRANAPGAGTAVIDHSDTKMSPVTTWPAPGSNPVRVPLPAPGKKFRTKS